MASKRRFRKKRVARGRTKRAYRGGGGGSCDFPRHKGNTYIFYHIYCNEHTFDVVRDQVTRIIFSGLYAYVDAINYALVGNKDKMSRIKEFLSKSGEKFKPIIEAENDTTYERITLNAIKHTVKADDIFLYIHSKGVGRHEGMKAENIWWWRNWMEYYLMYRFRECITELLKPTVDVVGCGYANSSPIGPHFVGNFWWTKGSYYATLPAKGKDLAIGSGYNDPETFIFKGHKPNGEEVEFVDMDTTIDLNTFDPYSHPNKFEKRSNIAIESGHKRATPGIPRGANIK